MRKFTITELQNFIDAKRQSVDNEVNRFRIESKEEGWLMKRTRPRDEDEIRALNLVMRQCIERAKAEGTFSYDPKKRVLTIARFSKSQK
jgi:hypothetical protein